MKYIATLIIMIFSQGALAEMLCSTGGSHDLSIGEEEFTVTNALEAINNLEKRIPELISENDAQQIEMIEEAQKNNKPIDIMYLRMTSVLMSEEFYIGHPNRLAIIRGALLKQNVLALKGNSQTGEYKAALDAFCNYAKTASYVD